MSTQTVPVQTSQRPSTTGNSCPKSPARPLSSTFMAAPITSAIPLPTAPQLPNSHSLPKAVAFLFAIAFPRKQLSLQPPLMRSSLISLFFTRLLVRYTSQSPLPTSSSRATPRAPTSACLSSNSSYKSTAPRPRQSASTIIPSISRCQQA